MRRVLLLLGGLLAGVALVLLPRPLAAAGTLYVDVANACPGTGTLADPYCTIQAAVDNATPGLTTIEIAAGDYNQSVNLNRDDLLLNGAGAGTTRIVGTTTGSGIFTTGSRSNLTIQNLSVTGFERGVHVRSGTHSGITLQDLTIAQNTLHGIHFGGGGSFANVTIQRVTVTGLPNSRHGIYFEPSFGGGSVTNLLVDTVTSSDNNTSLFNNRSGRGLFIINGTKDTITITNSTFENNRTADIDINDGTASNVTITNNTLGGAISLLAVTGGTSVVADNTISPTVRNSFFGSFTFARFGIEVKSSDGDLTIRNNTITFPTVSLPPTDDTVGILVITRKTFATDPDAANTVIEGNTVSGFARSNTSPTTRKGYGIVVEGSNQTVRNNTVSGNNVGIQVQGGLGGAAAVPGPVPTAPTPYVSKGTAPTTSATLAGNTVTGNTTAGLRVVSPNDPTATTAVIKGNTVNGGNAIALLQVDGDILAYANNFDGNTTPGATRTGGTGTLRNNWWDCPGTAFASSCISTFAAQDWQYRLGAAVQAWSEGDGSAALDDLGDPAVQNATLSGGTGTAVIVSYGAGTDENNAPFAKNDPDAGNQPICSDYFDVFVLPGATGTWQAQVPRYADAVQPGCSNVTTLYTFDLESQDTPAYTAACAVPPSDNLNACYWNDTPATQSGGTFTLGGQTPPDLLGTPLALGQIDDSNPTSITLLAFAAQPGHGHLPALLPVVVGLVLLAGAAGWLVRRRA